PPETPAAAVEQAISALLSRPQISIMREREGRVKTVDIRPYLFHLALRPESMANERLTLEMVVGLGEGGAAKPAEIVAALTEHLPGLTLRRAHRARLSVSCEEAALIP